MPEASLEFEGPPVGAKIKKDCGYADRESVVIRVEEVVSVNGARVREGGGGKFSGHGFLEDRRRAGEGGEADNENEITGGER
jgi:hypothetical protein